MRRTLWASAVAVGLAVLAVAATSQAQLTVPGGKVVVRSAVPDGAGHLTILGFNFGVRREGLVALDLQQLEIVSWDDEQIVVEMPDLEPGTYLLTVMRGRPHARYKLTSDDLATLDFAVGGSAGDGVEPDSITEVHIAEGTIEAELGYAPVSPDDLQQEVDARMDADQNLQGQIEGLAGEIGGLGALAYLDVAGPDNLAPGTAQTNLGFLPATNADFQNLYNQVNNLDTGLAARALATHTHFVTTAEIVNGTIKSEDIEDGTVTADKLAFALPGVAPTVQEYVYNAALPFVSGQPNVTTIRAVCPADKPLLLGGGWHAPGLLPDQTDTIILQAGVRYRGTFPTLDPVTGRSAWAVEFRNQSGGPTAVVTIKAFAICAP